MDVNPSLAPSTPIVTADQMRAIESRLFEHGIPVAALMEKVGQRLTTEILALFPYPQYTHVSILVGPGHNGGDALVMGRELWERGYQVKSYQPLQKAKPLTEAHLRYLQHLGIVESPTLEDWLQTDLVIDGLFGFGLARPISGLLAETVARINQVSVPVVSIDIPSGLHTDTGEVLGVAIAATRTFCLGYWKQAFFQEQALRYLGHATLIQFGIPLADQTVILGESPSLQTLQQPDFAQFLGRSPAVHKYEMGATLLVCGSALYPGAAILAAQAASATGVGMLYVAVPASIRDLIISQVPEAVVIACSETSTGAISSLPTQFGLKKLTAIAIGPGVTTEASAIVDQSLAWEIPLIIDADGLNVLAQLDWQPRTKQRISPTILTPHWGEFKRLFPEATGLPAAQRGDRITLLSQLPLPTQTTLILKGARTLIKGQHLRINPQSTPALARGGSGDTLTGLLAGLLAQNKDASPEQVAAAAVWWHAHAARLAEKTVTSAGVSPTALTQALLPYLRTVFDAQKVHQI